MFLGITYLEWIGYVSSVLVAVSLTMSSIVKLRWFNMIGAAIFSVYGFAIESYPVGLLNLFIVFTNTYYLTKIYARKETFKLISTSLSDSYLKYYLDFHKADISQFFPNFNDKLSKAIQGGSTLMTFLLLRDANVAGVIIGVKVEAEVHVIVDFVSKSYRDMKAGNYIYHKNIDRFKNEGIELMICETKHPEHKKYLTQMGFKSTSSNEDKEVFVKEI